VGHRCLILVMSGAALQLAFHGDELHGTTVI